MIQRTILRSAQAATRGTHPLRVVSRTPFQPSRLAAPSSISQRLQGRRWYSEAAETKNVNQAEAQGDKPTTGESVESAKHEAVVRELDGKKKEVVDLTDRLKRSVAEYRNLQDQTKREVQASRDFALQRFAKDLLDSIDNLERALSNVPPEKLSDEENQDLIQLHSGLKMTESILIGTLGKHGMQRFDPAETSEKFDPNKMEATFQAPQPGKEDGTVFYTQQKGFLYNGRVLRAAKVGVVKNS